MAREPESADEHVPTVLSARPSWTAASSRRFRLLVTEGPDRGRELIVDASQPSRVLVGTGPLCALKLTDAEVSRRHLAMSVRGGVLHVVDLESSNGTLANGVAIHDADLRGGEVVQLGRTVLRVESDGDQPTSLPAAMRFGRLVGGSPAMRKLYPLCERLAASDVPLLIEGETGTGKELLAESIHEASRRASAPFVVFDCTAVPPNLVESALFGHERGAFTGAIAARRGVFEQAHGGTLFLDEIGDLELPLQPKLLRAIERGEVQRVGSERWTKVEVRIVSATRRDLDRAVQEGRFRDDLFFRLAVTRIELPPLRERGEDIGLLARHFWRQLGGKGELPAEVLPRLADDSFPGNVRELHNLVARRLALGELDLPAPSVRPKESAAPLAADFIEEVLALDLPIVPSRQRVLAEFERRYTERLLARYHGDSALAAAASGIARRYFQLIRARLLR